jgi:nucleotide-binding universal stress UspA family protein
MTRGTVVCGVADDDAGHAAVATAAKLSERLGLRLVLARVADGIAPVDGEDSVTTRANREGAARLVARVAAEHGLAEHAERRWAVGDPAELLGQIAAEEAADVIVVGSRRRGLVRSRLDGQLASELESETPVPVLITAPRSRKATFANGRGR